MPSHTLLYDIVNQEPSGTQVVFVRLPTEALLSPLGDTFCCRIHRMSEVKGGDELL